MLLRLCSVAGVLVISCFTGLADVSPSSMFSDHMVLQRGMPVPVWGRAEPGERITVAFAGHEVSAVAGQDGRWMAALPAMKASSAGSTMLIQGSNKITFEDVLVGEVWICSGQSNMQYGWGNESDPMFNWGGDADLAALVPDARQRPIRSYHVPVNVAFEPAENCNGVWSTNVTGSAVAFGFSYHLQKALDVPVAVIVTCWGSSSIEGWMPRDLTEELPHFKAIMEAFDASTNTHSRVQAAIDRGVRHGNVFVRQQPNLLYNAMLHPVIPYAARGMVWYQGEANAGKPEQYAASLPAWVKYLRSAWTNDQFHFLAVMLPGYGNDSWPAFREVQAGVLKLPHTGIANTIDLGDARNIHPSDKAPIAERLSLLARRDVYGEKIEAQGPVFRSFELKGSSVAVEFDNADGLKTADGAAPTGFMLAGSNRLWCAAAAVIKDRQVELSAAEVAEPVHVRYAYAGKPDVNLVNGSGLPANPFRTDDWKE